MAVRELGQFRLKDFDDPIAIVQVDAVGSEAEFPPLRAASVRPHHLPTAATSFLGRTTELETLLDELERHHVVSLVGPGGSGKTRLAYEVASRVAPKTRGGVWIVELAPLTGNEVTAAIAEALGIDGGAAPLDAVVEHLSDSADPLLLIVDNCEHVVEEAALVVSALIDSSANLTVLATSREPLRVGVEHVVRLDPMRPEEAVALFFERAAASGAVLDRDADDAAELCRYLDGIPLAVELAAARASSLSPRQMLQRLSRGLGILDRAPRDAADRQRTMTAAIAWSYELLGASTQRLLRRASVFRHGFTLEGIEAVCDGHDCADELDDLVAGSLVTRETPASPRYRMLEVVRAFAWDQLDPKDRLATEDRFLSWALAEAERAAKESALDDDGVNAPRTSEAANLRAAAALAVDGARDPVTGARLLVSEGGHWLGHSREWLSLLRAVEARSELPLNLRLRLTWEVGNRHDDFNLRADAVAAFERVWSRRHLVEHDSDEGQTLFVIAWSALYLDDPTGALEFAERSLEWARQNSDVDLQMDAHNAIAVAAKDAGDLLRARRHYEQSLAIGSRFGRFHKGVELNLGLLDEHEGDVESARRRFRAVVDALRTKSSAPPIFVSALIFCAGASIELGEPGKAYAEALEGLQAAAEIEGPDSAPALGALNTLMNAQARLGYWARVVPLGAFLKELFPRGQRPDAWSWEDEVRSTMDPNEFEAAWARGAGMTPEDAYQWVRSLPIPPEDAPVVWDTPFRTVE